MSDRFSKPLLKILRKGGWFEGRYVSPALISPPELELFPKAQEVLSEFGGLHVGECGPGIDWATSDVEIAPRLGAHLAPELKEFEMSLGVRFFPLGEVHRSQGYLVIDDNGKTYLLNDELMPLAPSFAEGLERLLLGKRPPR